MSPTSVAVAPGSGTVHCVDGVLFTVRALLPNGTVGHVAGKNFVTSSSSSAADGLPASSTYLALPTAIAFDGAGRLLILEGCWTGKLRVVLLPSGLDRVTLSLWDKPGISPLGSAARVAACAARHRARHLGRCAAAHIMARARAATSSCSSCSGSSSSSLRQRARARHCR